MSQCGVTYYDNHSLVKVIIQTVRTQTVRTQTVRTQTVRTQTVPAPKDCSLFPCACISYPKVVEFSDRVSHLRPCGDAGGFLFARQFADLLR